MMVLCSAASGTARPSIIWINHALVAPAFPAVIKRLRRAIFLRRITPTQPVAVDEDDAAQNASIINALAASGSWGNRAEDEPFARPSAKTNYSSVGLLYAHLNHSRQFKSMGPDPRAYEMMCCLSLVLSW